MKMKTSRELKKEYMINAEDARRALYTMLSREFVVISPNGRN